MARKRQPRPAVSCYEDPAEPGRPRDLRCFQYRQPALDPERAGYRRSAGPCWYCEHGAWHYIIQLALTLNAVDAESVAARLKKASVAAFALSRAVREDTGSGVLELDQMSPYLAKRLHDFRHAWNAAQIATLIQDGPEPRWRWAEMPSPDGVRFLNPGSVLAVSPAVQQSGVIRAGDIEKAAGWLSVLSSAFQSEFESHKADKLGADAFAVRWIEQHRASPLALAERVATLLSPDGQLTERGKANADAMAVRWRKALERLRKRQAQAAAEAEKR